MTPFKPFRLGVAGVGFVVDNSGRLIAHPDETLVLRQTLVSVLPYRLSNSFGIRFGKSFSGQRVVTASHDITGSSWQLVVEQPIGEALMPVYAALITTGVLSIGSYCGLSHSWIYRCVAFVSTPFGSSSRRRTDWPR